MSQPKVDHVMRAQPRAAAQDSSLVLTLYMGVSLAILANAVIKEAIPNQCAIAN